MINNIKKLLREGLVNETNDCDCCGYFDMSSINDYGFDKPLYRIVEKWELIELEFMPPKQYIYRIARGFGGLSYEDVVSGAEPEIFNKYAEAMKNGAKFPVGFYKDGQSGQEGRHRALAAMKLGCEQIPVVKIKELTFKDVMEFVAEHKDHSIEDFNRIYSDFPYSGVTQLGYNTFKRKIEILNNQ